MAERRIIKGWIVERRDDGTIVPIAPADGGQGGGPPADPGYQYEGPSAAANLEGQQLTNQERRAGLRDRERGELPKGYRWGADGVAELIPGVPEPAQSATAVAAAQKAEGENRRAATISTLMGQVRQLYGQDIKGGWPNAISGRVPALMRPANEEFNAAANGILPLIRPLVAQSAKEGDSDKEMQVFMAYIPQAHDDDRTIERKMSMLETLIGGMTGGSPPSQVVKDIDEGVVQVPGGAPGQELRGYVGSDQGPVFGPGGSGDAPPPPTRGAPGAQTRDTFMGAIDAVGRNFANAGTLGLADKLSAGANALLPIDNLFGANNRSVWDGSSFGQAYDANMGLQSRTNAADDQVNPIASATGDVGGSITGMLGANSLLRGLGAGGLVARTGGIAGDTLYGAARGGVEDGARGALINGGLAAGGGALGRYVVGPALGAAAATRPGQAVVNAAGRGANAVANAGRGLIGRGPNRYQPVQLPASLPRGQQAVVSRLPDDATAQLREAGDMGMPLAISDLSPELQALTGSVVRKSADARTMAENTLRPRFLGQADRARDQISRNFGPIDNPNEVSEGLIQTARQNSRPLYEAFRSQPARTSDDLEAMLATPAGRQALQNARNIAANEGRDPNAMGFDLDDLGQVVLRRDSSPETLDLVKRGFDDVLDGYRDPTSGRLNLDEGGRAVEGLRQRYVAEADRLYPDTYPQARAAYAGPAAERAALQSGRDMSRAHPRDISDRMGRMSDPQREQYRLGQRVAMSDTVDRARLNSNPYQSVWGGGEARDRAATVFGDEPAARFQRAYDIEENMGRTFTEALGGSQTAPRLAADEAFDSMAGNVAEAGGAVLTGGGGLGQLARNLAGGLRDNWRVGASRARADEMAPLLLAPRPAEMARAIEALAAQSAARRLYIDRARSAGGLIGASGGIALAPTLR